HVAARDDLVVAVGFGVAGVLHAQVVLVGVEVWQRVEPGVVVEHGRRGGGGLVEGVGPVLDPDVFAQQRVVGAGDVAGGVDVRVCAAQRRVDHDAVVDVQTRVARQLGGGGGADPDEHGVAFDLGAVGQSQPGCLAA